MYPRSILILILGAGLLCGWLAGYAQANAAPEYEAFVVQQGQTLATVAEEYGLTVEYLAQYNGLRATDTLSAGQVLLVPLGLPAARATAPAPSPGATPPAPRNTPPNRGPLPGPQTPAKEQVTGIVGTVVVAKADIKNRPDTGTVIFDGAVRGTQLLVIGQTDKHYAIFMADGSTGWLPKITVALSGTQMTVDKPTPPPLAARAAAATGDIPITPLLRTAFEYIGLPYRYGGRLPYNVDCSLFVQTVFRRHGIKLPRTAAQQYEVGTPVDVDQLQAGDRLYFYNRGGGDIGHTGIYLGNGRFIHASSNRGMVGVDELTNPTYWKKYAGARR